TISKIGVKNFPIKSTTEFSDKAKNKDIAKNISEKTKGDKLNPFDMIISELVAAVLGIAPKGPIHKAIISITALDKPFGAIDVNEKIFPLLLAMLITARSVSPTPTIVNPIPAVSQLSP